LMTKNTKNYRVPYSLKKMWIFWQKMQKFYS
jgi:hypothetical protein